mmetsp:Transcript_83827/g.161819  ORF Transcript_83827/g.161819 Transcript_83827/m.161819 type:complete len:246 (-) Transcript_83827:328-1065(-)
MTCNRCPSSQQQPATGSSSQHQQRQLPWRVGIWPKPHVPKLRRCRIKTKATKSLDVMATRLMCVGFERISKQCTYHGMYLRDNHKRQMRLPDGVGMKPELLPDAPSEQNNGFSTEGADSPSLLMLKADVSRGMPFLQTESLRGLPNALFEWPVLVLRNHVLQGGFFTAKVGSSKLLVPPRLEISSDGKLHTERLRGFFTSWSVLLGVPPMSGLPGVGLVLTMSKDCFGLFVAGALIMPFAVRRLG